MRGETRTELLNKNVLVDRALQLSRLLLNEGDGT